jgi:hypothetical protein
MRRIVSICLLVLSAAALLAAAPGASAAKKKASASTPTITRVQPMRISVGGTLTISGKNFKAKRSANTVIFRSPSGRTAFAKPKRASRTKLVVTVPAAVSRLLNVSGSRVKPTRLKLRVLAGRFSKYTTRRLSPVVTSPSDGDGVPGGETPKVCKNDSDHDNDLLANDLELSIGTDPCLEDTDGDAMTDGWEYWSAKDLNIKAVPYPGKRPFTNALDPSDGSTGTFSAYDFDGDGLTSREEYRAWRYTGSSLIESKAGGADLESPLGYSDGTKFSRSSETPGVPAWRSASYGLPNPTQPFPATFNLHDDAPWRDSERDADGDGISNWLESARGPYANSWQEGFWAVDAVDVDPWKEQSYCGQRPGFFDERPFQNLDMADSDVDGDSLLDGEDDQDNDDFSNIIELYEIHGDVDGNGVAGVNPSWCGRGVGVVGSILIDGDGDGSTEDWAVNAFNPCAPSYLSRTCSDYIPFG